MRTLRRSHNDTFILKVLREPCLKQPQRTKYKSSDGTVYKFAFQIVHSNPINLSVHFTLEIIFILSRTKFPLQNRFQCLLQQELIHAKFYLKSFEADAWFTLALVFCIVSCHLQFQNTTKSTLPKADCLATFLHERGAPKMSFYCSLRVMFPPSLAPRVYFSRSLFFSEIVRRLVWSLFAFHARVVNVATKLNSASTTCVSPSTPTLFFSWFFYFVLCGTFDRLCIVLLNWIERLKIRIDGNTDWRPWQTAATFP